MYVKRAEQPRRTANARIGALLALQLLILGGIVYRLYDLQIGTDAAHIAQELGVRLTIPSGTLIRGQIFVKDGGYEASSDLFPVATNDITYTLIQQGSADIDAAAWSNIGALLDISFENVNTARAKAGFYTVLKRGVSEEMMLVVKPLLPPNMRFDKQVVRVYPDKRFGGHVIGFLGYDSNGRRSGQYGLEEYYESMLQPQKADGIDLDSVVGDDIILTIDRAVQYKACELIAAGVESHEARSGSITIMYPETGAIVALCSYPDFYPQTYSSSDIAMFKNPVVSTPYEPGSTFKSITMAAGIDTGVVSADEMYMDTGEEKIDIYTIRNSDKKSHGMQTMTAVLQKSLNTGTIHVSRKLGHTLFTRYIDAFGFGSKTGIDVAGEAAGNLASLDSSHEIYTATASFGQGITATPLQMLSAYSAIANDGILMKPYIVAERHSSDGSVWMTEPVVAGEAINERSAKIVSGMLASVLKFGHAQKARIPGYTFAGKTGTAQIAADTGGYEKDVTMQSFIGFGPVIDTKFAMLVMYDRPNTSFAERSALPTWKTMTEWLIDYWHIRPDAELIKGLVEASDSV